MQSKFPDAMQTATVSDAWCGWLASRRRSLEASSRAEKTLRAYDLAMMQLGRYCVYKSYPQDVLRIDRAIIEEFLVFTRNTHHSAYTIRSYFEGIHRFYTWLIDEEDITEHPMAKIKMPIVPDSDREVMSPDEVTALMKTCAGNDFNQRRDMAILYVLIDTGLRLNELTSITLANLDLKEKVIHIPPVTSKGGKVRDVPIGVKATAALDRYIRKRASHKYAECQQLWIGRVGPIWPDSIRQMITRRCKNADLPHVFPHLFRHTFAHMWLADEGSEGDLKSIGGWRSDVMERYGRKLKGDRARNAHKLHSPGDKF